MRGSVVNSINDNDCPRINFVTYIMRRRLVDLVQTFCYGYDSMDVRDLYCLLQYISRIRGTSVVCMMVNRDLRSVR